MKQKEKSKMADTLKKYIKGLGSLVALVIASSAYGVRVVPPPMDEYTVSVSESNIQTDEVNAPTSYTVESGTTYTIASDETAEINQTITSTKETPNNNLFMSSLFLYVILVEVTGISLFLLWLFWSRGILKDWESHKKNVKEQFRTISNGVKGVQSSINSLQTQSNSANTKITEQLSEANNLLNELKESMQQLETTLASQHSETITKIDAHSQTLTDGIATAKNEAVVSMTDLLQSLFAAQAEAGKRQIESLKGDIVIVRTKIEELAGQESENSQNHSQNLVEIKNVWKQHLDTVKPFELLLAQTEILYGNLLKEQLKIAEQEESLSAMVARHTHIAELTDELNKTAKDVFELMRLYLMNSIVEYTNVES